MLKVPVYTIKRVYITCDSIPLGALENISYKQVSVDISE